MTRPVLIITCGEPDATAFLMAQPRMDLERTLLVGTSNVVAAAERLTMVGETFVLAGPATFGAARRLLAENVHIRVVVAPDPWGPFKGKGYVRARQVLPFVLPDAPIDLIALEPGGAAGRTRRSVSRAWLGNWLRRREAVLVGEFIVRAGIGGPGQPMPMPLAVPYALVRLAIGIPVGFVTLARCVSFIARTESRVLMEQRRSPEASAGRRRAPGPPDDSSRSVVGALQRDRH